MKNKEHQAQAIYEILERFDDDRKIQHLKAYEVSQAIPLDEAFMLIPRLERAAVNQIDDASATVLRYVIWAETVRGILLSAEADVAEGNLTGDILRKLRKCINALSAFSEIQQIFDRLDR